MSTPPKHFSTHPDFQRKIATLICVYSLEVCEQKIKETHEHYVIYHENVIVCLRFHAAQSLKNIDEVAQCLQEERSPSNGTSLEGNPLRDCILAVAMLTKENKAIVVFENDYYGYLKGIAYKVHPRLGNAPDEWWNEFLDFLAGYSHPNGKLKKYQGKSALRFWLRVVLWNFLRRRPIPQAAAEIVEDVAETKPDNNDIELNETIALFTGIVRDSLQTMPVRDRLLLSMIYLDNLRAEIEMCSAWHVKRAAHLA